MRLPNPRLLGLLGVLGSLFWLSLNTILSPDWGPPGSANYLGYETVNRLWAPALAGMLCGYAGLYARYGLGAWRLGRASIRLIGGGFALMIAGNVAEFWFFSEQAYGVINGRNLAWMGVLLGMLALLIGLALLGAAGLRAHALPRWSSILFLLALPATIVAIAAAVELMGLATVIAGLAAGALAAWPGTAPVVSAQSAV